jgi:hypothetical protein
MSRRKDFMIGIPLKWAEAIGGTQAEVRSDLQPK